MNKPIRFKPVSKAVKEKGLEPMKKFEEFRKYRHTNYREDRKMYVDQDERASAFYDKTIITLSSSAFGLTATLISKIFNPLAPGSIEYLGWALGCFGGSMISTLCSYLVGHLANSKQIQFLDEHQKSEDMGGEPKITKLRYVVLLLNYLPFLLFVLGSWEITRFIILNVSNNVLK